VCVFWCILCCIFVNSILPFLGKIKINWVVAVAYCPTGSFSSQQNYVGTDSDFCLFSAKDTKVCSVVHEYGSNKSMHKYAPVHWVRCPSICRFSNTCLVNFVPGVLAVIGWITLAITIRTSHRSTFLGECSQAWSQRSDAVYVPGTMMTTTDSQLAFIHICLITYASCACMWRVQTLHSR